MDLSLADRYQAYLKCLNDRDLAALGKFVADDVRYNGETIGLSGYREMLEGNYRDIPDLKFVAELMIVSPPWLAARLWFDCTPKAVFLGLPIHGRRVAFAENVFYQFHGDRIVDVRSVVDKAAIQAQL